MTRTLALFLVVLVSTLASTPAQCREQTSVGGRQLYLEECARCHGVDRKGDGPDAPFFSPEPRDLTTGFVGRYTPEELIARVRDGTPLSLSVDAEGRKARAQRVEAILAYMHRLPTIDWKAVDAGGVLYGERCEICHGQFGKPWPASALPEGVQTSPPDLRAPKFQRSMSDRELLKAMRHGIVGMPAVPPELTDEQARQLLAFVRLLSPGFESYSFYCAPCHGDDGRGRGILPRDDEEPKVVFDKAYFEKKDPEALRAAVWHMIDAGGGGMPHFKGVIDEAQLRRIVEYLQNTP